ncbi:outer membrane protein insertion porin family [Catalinimonas alkaloidigena]|uniref:Outer membrane protein insertion porin family n=1 Tax=Catalinimonas alkaloidigena TaxID=1075417 RepID=A0A1G8XNG5_9BACT|nr:BamA/TamA family outer membrane protein [Catalinimonas alkaloidigena]SDJ92149.1 outer membrane protein insertion porin family [Catalinimonas alkaloidigena]
MHIFGFAFLVLCFLTTSGLAQSADSLAGRFVVEEVHVIGTQQTQPAALEQLSGLAAGDTLQLPGPQLQEALHRLWQQGVWSDLEVQVIPSHDDRVQVVFRIDEYPRFGGLDWQGISLRQARTLEKALALHKGQLLTDAVRGRVRRYVLQQLREKGYHQAQVETALRPDSVVSRTVRLQVKVTPGPRLKLQEVRFTGSAAFLPATLRQHLRPLRFRPFHRQRYTPDERQTALRHLQEFYQSRGYLDAHLTDTLLVGERGTTTWQIAVQEGAPYRLDSLVWSGNALYNDSILTQAMPLRPGDVLDLPRLEAALQLQTPDAPLAALYLDRGYPAAEASWWVVPTSDRTATVRVALHEGKQAHFGTVQIVGNERTHDHVIRRELPPLPGTLFSRQALVRAQLALSQLSFLDPTQLGVRLLPNATQDTMGVELRVAESPKDRYELAGTWVAGVGPVGSLGLNLYNFSLHNLFRPRQWHPVPAGDGQQLLLRLQTNGRPYQNYSLSFVEPWLGGRRANALQLTLSHSVLNGTNPLVISAPDTNTDGRLTLTSIATSWSRPLPRLDAYTSLNLAATYNRYGLRNFEYDLGFSTGAAHSVSLRTALVRNHIDDPIYPHKGSQLALALTLTPPYSLLGQRDPLHWIEYHKWMADARAYWPLGKAWVLETRAHVGYLGTYTRHATLGPFERFYLGGRGLAGPNTLLGSDLVALRGYDDLTLTPTDEAGHLLGGTLYQKFSLELRHLLLQRSAATAYLLGFAEAGNTWLPSQPYQPFSLYRAAGLGLRVHTTTFGWLGIDVGWGFDPLPNGQRTRQPVVQFLLGLPIR